MINRFQLFLGPARFRAFILLFGLTGLASLILNTVVNQYEWVRPVQSLLLAVFVVGAFIIVGGRLPPEERARWTAILLPAFIAIFIALLVAPQVSGLLIGGAFGWIVAALFLTRPRAPMEYRDAVKHLRKNNYAESIKVMDRLIKSEPDQANHYRFRAEVYRVWGKLDRAARDYQQMTELAPESPVAFNGLAEVYLQRNDYERALAAARKANELAPNDWVTFYNLGMIEDRLKQSSGVIEHLTDALKLKVKDARHRALIYFYLVRAHVRLGETDAATQHLNMLKRTRSGLEEWQSILDSDQAETLKAVLGGDIAAAQQLVHGEFQLDDLK